MLQSSESHLEARDMAVPGSVVLGMLCCHPCCSAIRAPEDNGNTDGAG